jgi:hypothetical protein
MRPITLVMQPTIHVPHNFLICAFIDYSYIMILHVIGANVMLTASQISLGSLLLVNHPVFFYKHYRFVQLFHFIT